MKNLTVRFGSFCAFALLVVLFSGSEMMRLAAQQTTGTILGTATDASGASVPGANVQVKNVGTGQIQTVQSDAQGRYRVPDLPVGDYEVQASKQGFSTVVQKGIELSVGSQNVVDFSLAVGQAQQTVTVEAQTTQVETTDSTVASLVNQTQMRELPLNGRNFEQLIQLAPGVQNYYPGSSGANMREGRDPAISIGGSRPEGQLFLMDDQNLETFYNRGLGSITGTSLGVDAISEFQTLTNTYSSQFGGAGAVMNAVSKSGANAFHGSVFEFLRNSDFDARNFTDPANVPEFHRNQYGGTIGGPIKKNKLFFFANYEGIQSVQGVSNIATVPITRTATTSNAQTAAAIDAVLALYPAPVYNINTAAGTGQLTVVKNNTAYENYGLGASTTTYRTRIRFSSAILLISSTPFIPSAAATSVCGENWTLEPMSSPTWRSGTLSLPLWSTPRERLSRGRMSPVPPHFPLPPSSSSRDRDVRTAQSRSPALPGSARTPGPRHSLNFSYRTGFPRETI